MQYIHIFTQSVLVEVSPRASLLSSVQASVKACLPEVRHGRSCVGGGGCSGMCRKKTQRCVPRRVALLIRVAPSAATERTFRRRSAAQWACVLRPGAAKRCLVHPDKVRLVGPEEWRSGSGNAAKAQDDGCENVSIILCTLDQDRNTCFSLSNIRACAFHIWRRAAVCVFRLQ